MILENTPLPDDIRMRLPGPQIVTGHEVNVDGARWRSALTERNLPSLAGKLADADRTTVARGEVFALGDQEPTVENAYQLLYYSLAWGLGTRASRLHQRLDGLAQHPVKAGDLLVSAWTTVRQGAPTKDAYSVLTTNRGGGRISWFGPAFSTKFLYFAQGTTAEPRHLILDQVVARNLQQDAWPQAPTAGWWPETYQRYCTLLSQWAAQASAHPDINRPVRPDEIELTLFRRNHITT